MLYIDNLNNCQSPVKLWDDEINWKLGSALAICVVKWEPVRRAEDAWAEDALAEDLRAEDARAEVS